MRGVFSVVLLGGLSLWAQSDGPPVTFRSDVALARVDAQVVDGGNRPIRGLGAEDFVLRVDGKQQEIHNFQSESTPVDVILLLDVSRSMEPHVQRVARASRQALRVLGDQDRIAVMVFDRSTRVRMPFRASRQEAGQELGRVMEDETFDGGTDITRGLLDAANYMADHAREGARRAIVILTDDQTELERNDAAVLRALSRADAVLSALIAPDALHTGTGSGNRGRDLGMLDEQRLRQMFGDMLPPGFPGSFGRMGARTQSAGTSKIATRSGGDSMTVDDASAFENTLARIRERYALYFYLPEGAKAGDELPVEVELSEAAKQKYPGATVNHRRTYLTPGKTEKQDRSGVVRVSYRG